MCYQIAGITVEIQNFQKISDRLIKELQYRKSLLRGQTHSLKTIFIKQNSKEGQVKVLYSDLARENIKNIYPSLLPIIASSLSTMTENSGRALCAKDTDTFNFPVHQAPVIKLAANVRDSTARPSAQPNFLYVDYLKTFETQYFIWIIFMFVCR